MASVGALRTCGAPAPLTLVVRQHMIARQIEAHFPGDHPRTIAWRTHLISVCEQFIASGLADSKFTQELASGSRQKFWACLSEALIAHRLKGATFGQRSNVGQGPDFLVMNGDQKVWIEVVCPEPARVPAEWLSSATTSGVVDFPHREILLRWTSAIKAKAEVLMGNSNAGRDGYLKSGLVGSNDAYVIAVNGCQLRSGPSPALHGISQLPFAVEAVFPVGPYQVKIDRTSLAAMGGEHQHRPVVPNHNNSLVPATLFIDPNFRCISAIWAVDLNGGQSIGNAEPMALIHNPLASNPIPPGFLPVDEDDEEIQFISDSIDEVEDNSIYNQLEELYNQVVREIK